MTSKTGYPIREVELLQTLSPDDWVILNGDDRMIRDLAEQTNARVVMVGRGSHCDVMARSVSCDDEGLVLRLDGLTIRVPVWGRHHVHSVLSAFAVARIVRVDDAEVKENLSKFEAPAGRCEVVRRELVTVIDDTYDDRYESMLAALAALRDAPAKRRIVICGELESVVNGPDVCREIGRLVVSECGADLLVACGEYGEHVAAAARQAGMPVGAAVGCVERWELENVLENLLLPGDVVLVKGRQLRGMAGLTGPIETNSAAERQRVKAA